MKKITKTNRSLSIVSLAKLVTLAVTNELKGRRETSHVVWQAHFKKLKDKAGMTPAELNQLFMWAKESGNLKLMSSPAAMIRNMNKMRQGVKQAELDRIDTMKLEELENGVLMWAHEKGIMKQGTRVGQGKKTVEEAAELLAAVTADDDDEILDGCGDVIVTVIIQAAMNGFSVRDALAHAYKTIRFRKGEMKNGQFVKVSK